MLFELKEVFLNDGKSKKLSYLLDMSGVELDGVFPFLTPFEVSALAVNRASLVTLTLNVKFDYRRLCDRCCEELIRKMDMEFSHKLAIKLVSDENDDYIETPDYKLELDDVVSDDVLLSLPQKNLCKSDCKGLCEICGKNLNFGDCGCDRRNVGSGFEILKQLTD